VGDRRQRIEGELKRCASCGEETETLITNVVNWASQCPRCCWGEDQMMLRRVMLTTATGTEVHFVRAVNNGEAFRMLWREDVSEGLCWPLAN
jgi:hypothetical protein